MTLRTILPFLAITFGLTWGLALAWVLFGGPLTEIFGSLSMTNPLFLLAVYAPGIAALTLVLRHHGLRGLHAFLGRLALWRCGPGWWAFLLVGIPLLMWMGALVKGTAEFPFSTWTAALAAVGTAMVVGPMEEFGWRGLMLPLLQQRFHPIQAALLLGAVWGLWHVPAFLLSGTPQSSWNFLPYFLAVLSASIIISGLFNASGGSLLLAMLIHFQLNNPLLPDAQPYDAASFAVAALVIVWIGRGSFFSNAGAATRVIPY